MLSTHTIYVHVWTWFADTIVTFVPPQEMATVFVDKLDVKVVLLNNQHLGMVMQWEDRFYKVGRPHMAAFCHP